MAGQKIKSTKKPRNKACKPRGVSSKGTAVGARRTVLNPVQKVLMTRTYAQAFQAKSARAQMPGAR